MTPAIAAGIAHLLNTQNKLAHTYTGEEILTAAQNYLFRVDAAGTVVGAVEVKKVQWYQCEISHLSVSVKRQGHGSSLVIEALAKGKEMGARVAQCTIRVGNAESESLFTKHGFSPGVTFMNYGTSNRVTTFHKALTP